MRPHPELLRALADAVDREPDLVPLRLHLADLLLAAGAETAALAHYELVLAGDPGNVEARAGARRAAATAAGLSAGAPVAVEGPSGGPEVARQPERPDWWDAEFPIVRLADVGGMDDVKRHLEVAFIGPLRRPDVLRAYGRSIGGGLLLYGPPGCGKTFVARAVAGEIGASFLSAGGPDALDMWMEEPEKRLHDVFEAARRDAPCLLFFDELDAIGQRRSRVVNQLLAELDGAGGRNDGVFVLGATNHLWDVDPALLRPGRLDRLALVALPDRAARLAILRSRLGRSPSAGVTLEPLARRTDGFSGADLVHLCETAVEYALEESLADGAVRPVTDRDFVRALKEVRPSTGPWFEAARNYVLFANASGLYDDLRTYMRQRKLL
jgi:AAA+ superfamily predicted ATPase